MNGRKLGIGAGGASIVAAAMLLNVGAATASDGICTTYCGDVPTAIVKIDAIFQKVSDKPAADKLQYVVFKLEQVLVGD